MTGHPRCAILPVTGHLGLYLVLTPSVADYLAHLKATVIVDHAMRPHYLTQARRKADLLHLDPGARLIQIGVDEAGRIACFSDDP